MVGEQQSYRNPTERLNEQGDSTGHRFNNLGPSVCIMSPGLNTKSYMQPTDCVLWYLLHNNYYSSLTQRLLEMC